MGAIFGLLVLGWLAATALPVFFHARPHVGLRQAASWALRSLI